jgi:hypothetical protein
MEPQYGIDFAVPGQSPSQTQPVEASAAEAAPEAPPQPQPNQPQPQPRSDQAPDGGGGVHDALKEVRERIRPTGIR